RKPAASAAAAASSSAAARRAAQQAETRRRRSAETCENRIDLRLFLRLVGQLRPVQQIVLALASFGSLAVRRRALARHLVTEGAEQARDTILDMLQRLHDLGNSLAGNVLEIARFVDLRDGRLDALGMRRIELRTQAFDGLGGIEDVAGRLFGGADDGIELVGRQRDVVRPDLLRPHRGDLALGALDELRQLLELAIELEIDHGEIAGEARHDALDDGHQLGGRNRAGAGTQLGESRLDLRAGRDGFHRGISNGSEITEYRHELLLERLGIERLD